MSVTITDAWRLVPVEPTDEMLRAIRRQRSGARVGKGDRADWAAWLAAAPAPDPQLMQAINARMEKVVSQQAEGSMTAPTLIPAKAAIAIDEWKLSIFERRLQQAGYSWTNAGHLIANTLILRVDTTNLEALAVVVKAANDEAAQTGAPK